jgi:hypothetical protein
MEQKLTPINLHFDIPDRIYRNIASRYCQYRSYN